MTRIRVTTNIRLAISMLSSFLVGARHSGRGIDCFRRYPFSDVAGLRAFVILVEPVGEHGYIDERQEGADEQAADRHIRQR